MLDLVASGIWGFMCGILFYLYIHKIKIHFPPYIDSRGEKGKKLSLLLCARQI